VAFCLAMQALPILQFIYSLTPAEFSLQKIENCSEVEIIGHYIFCSNIRTLRIRFPFTFINADSQLRRRFRGGDATKETKPRY
jgi:hypothetical protein